MSDIAMTVQFDVLLPLPLTSRGPSYTCGMLARGMATRDFDVTVVTPRARGHSVFPANVIQTLPKWAWYAPYRWVRSLGQEIETAFLSQANGSRSGCRAAYIWPDASPKTINLLKLAGVIVFREMINCHRASAKVILDDAYARIGARPNHLITAASASLEQECLEAVDYVFCPNPMVEASLLENGLPSSKLIAASYGWDPDRFRGSHRLLAPYDGITAVFAGSICVRKGCHLLLDYWARSNTRGRLVLAGVIEPLIKQQYSELLARSDVTVLDYVSDVGALYRSADVFVFPSLEEGGPQVTYEACGCGLPVITTPMGAGRIVRDGREGFVLDPYDSDGWIAAIRALGEDHDRRRSMGVSATQRAELFHWDTVALRRRQQVLDRLTSTRPDANNAEMAWSST